MIRGTVDAQLQVVVPLIVRGTQGQELHLQGIVDTGYNGALTLPSHVITYLGLPDRGVISVQLADGSEIYTYTHECEIVWEGKVVRVVLESSPQEPLVGTSLLAGHELLAQFCAGGAVTLEKLP
jgi:clan AA aspartic protease